MACWLMKTEPDAYSWQELVRTGRGTWDGVRNYAARNHMRAMKIGDRVAIYHSNQGKEIVGIAEIVREAFQDPTTDDVRWSAVEVAPLRALQRPVPLTTLKAEHAAGGDLGELEMLRQGRLSVVPLREREWRRILQLGETTLE